ncbi:MAG: hypothetical protein ACPG47_10045, partial [Leucothrix sp.]
LKNTSIAENTTYNITGACTGPIYVEVDNVHLLGTSNTSDSIVLPAGIEDSAVWAGGAYNLQITNLFLDLTATTTEKFTAGIWARSAYVRVRDSRIQGGSTGINPFRGAIVRLDGANSITEFASSGLNASDQSNINTRGQVTLSSTRTDDQYMKAVAAYRGGNVDIRGGVTVSVPAATDARAIHAESNASVQIRDSGTVELNGGIYSSLNSSIRIEKGTITGKVEARRSSSLKLDNVIVVTGRAKIDGSNLQIEGGSLSGDIDLRNSSSLTADDVTIAGRIKARRGSSVYLEGVTQTSDESEAVNLSMNASLVSYDSSLGHLGAYLNSSFSLSDDGDNASSVKGVLLYSGAVGDINNTSVTGDVVILRPAEVFLRGSTNLNGNNVYGCNSESHADDTVIGIANLATASDCRP